jgi:DNA-binding Lrp family transcriptional regulator
LDKLDISLIREMSQTHVMLPAKVGLRSSYRVMARKLKVSPSTVRDRLAKMYATGVLSGTSVYVNPSLIALKGAAYAADVSHELSKEEVISKVRKLDDLLFIHNHRGSYLGLAFAYSDEKDLERKVQTFNKLAGTKNGELLGLVAYPPSNTGLTGAEWKLIARLSEKPFQSYAELAKEFRASSRTMKRRLTKLIEKAAILSGPKLDYVAMAGGVPADLVVVFDSRESMREAERKIVPIVGEYLLFAGPGEDFAVYNLVVPRMSAASDLARRIKEIDGVRSVRAELVDQHIDLTQNLGAAQIRARISDS